MCLVLSHISLRVRGLYLFCNESSGGGVSIGAFLFDFLLDLPLLQVMLDQILAGVDAFGLALVL